MPDPQRVYHRWILLKRVGCIDGRVRPTDYRRDFLLFVVAYSTALNTRTFARAWTSRTPRASGIFTVRTSDQYVLGFSGGQGAYRVQIALGLVGFVSTNSTACPHALNAIRVPHADGSEELAHSNDLVRGPLSATQCINLGFRTACVLPPTLGEH